jgi:hypothetical protein
MCRITRLRVSCRTESNSADTSALGGRLGNQSVFDNARIAEEAERRLLQYFEGGPGQDGDRSGLRPEIAGEERRMRRFMSFPDSYFGQLDRTKDPTQTGADASARPREALMAYDSLSGAYRRNYGDPLDPSAFMRTL